MKRWRNLIWPCLLLMSVSPVLATFIAEACSELVQQALDATDVLCETTGRNQVCYGHAQLEAQSQPNQSSLIFDTAGDMVNVSDVQSLHLSPFQVENGDWGIALMRLQANLPSSELKDLTLLTFGDVRLNNAVQTSTRLDVAVAGANFVNVRRLPSVDSGAVGVLSPGQTVTAFERLEDNSWLRIELPETGETGWLAGALVSAQSDVTSLNIAQARQPFYRPMQAFYFQSSTDASACPEVPANGLLIQTPEGVGEVKLLINEVNIQVGSTVLFRAEPGGDMVITTLEGHARVEAMGVIHTAIAGSQVRVPLDENLKPAGPPSPPETYDATTFQTLPLGNLERLIDIHTGLTQQELQQLQEEAVAENSIILEGSVQAINGNIIRMLDLNIEADYNDPVLPQIRVGSMIRVESNWVAQDNITTITAITITILNTPTGNSGNNNSGTGNSGIGNSPIIEPTPSPTALPPNCKITKKGTIKCSKKK